MTPARSKAMASEPGMAVSAARSRSRASRRAAGSPTNARRCGAMVDGPWWCGSGPASSRLRRSADAPRRRRGGRPRGAAADGEAPLDDRVGAAGAASVSGSATHREARRAGQADVQVDVERIAHGRGARQASLEIAARLGEPQALGVRVVPGQPRRVRRHELGPLQLLGAAAGTVVRGARSPACAGAAWRRAPALFRAAPAGRARGTTACR